MKWMLWMTVESSLSGPYSIHRLYLVQPGYLVMLWMLTIGRFYPSNLVFPLGDLLLTSCGSPWRG